MTRSAWSRLAAESVSRLGTGLASRISRVKGTSSRSRYHENRPAEDASPYVSVLDCGQGVIKAMVLDAGATPPMVLAAAVQPAPEPTTAGEADFGSLVAAVEQALVAAEDGAEVVPRRVVLGVAGSVPAAGFGRTVARRPRPAAPVTRQELTQALGRARRTALASAQQDYNAEHADSVELEVVNAAVQRIVLDGRPIARPAEVIGLAGEDLDISVVTSVTAVSEVRRQRHLAEALDLEVAGLVGMPFALAAALRSAARAGAVVVDVGAHTTTVALVGPQGMDGALSFPVGGAALEVGVAGELGVDVSRARELIAAHTAGAG
ncbi:MAG: hypothetical protein ACRDJN_22855, partial [Chloroflexota bacterium]